MPKISVIIPCYNYGRFIEETVQSVFDQTFQDFEIIIVNDGSTDEYTLEVLKKIKMKHPQITLLNRENGGPANARNVGVKNSQGDYFFPLDADDKIHPEMLEKCLSILEKNHSLGFVYTYTKFFDQFDAVLVRPEYSFYRLLQRNYLVVSSLIRKKTWEEVGGYDQKMRNGYEDWEFYIRLGKNGWFGELIREPLFLYREHGGESKNKEAKKKHAENFEYIKRKHADIYKEEKLREIQSEWSKKNNKRYWRPVFYMELSQAAFFILKRYGMRELCSRILRRFDL